MIRLVSIVAVLAVIALVFLVVIPWVKRRHDQATFDNAEKREITRYQNKAALEDLDRTRRRINEAQDRMHQEGQP